MEGSIDDPELARYVEVGEALDRELLRAQPPTPEQIETEIQDLVKEAPDLGEDPAETEQTLRGLTYAFWRDWFAVDALITPLQLQDEEVWNICLAREARRKPSVFGPQA
ncbi:MAG TPA: hypothetical protein VFX49_17595 [Chloroflexota bacterium]|nr:hypothetical protein [Chloroflexota bacterium]